MKYRITFLLIICLIFFHCNVVYAFEPGSACGDNTDGICSEYDSDRTGISSKEQLNSIYPGFYPGIGFANYELCPKSWLDEGYGCFIGESNYSSTSYYRLWKAPRWNNVGYNSYSPSMRFFTVDSSNYYAPLTSLADTSYSSFSAIENLPGSKYLTGYVIASWNAWSQSGANGNLVNTQLNHGTYTTNVMCQMNGYVTNVNSYVTTNLSNCNSLYYTSKGNLNYESFGISSNKYKVELAEIEYVGGGTPGIVTDSNGVKFFKDQNFNKFNENSLSGYNLTGGSVDFLNNYGDRTMVIKNVSWNQNTSLFSRDIYTSSFYGSTPANSSGFRVFYNDPRFAEDLMYFVVYRFTFEIVPKDRVCTISDDSLDGCTGDSVDALCSEMTVYAQTASGEEINAIVKIDETASLISGEDSNYDDKYNSYFGGLYPKYYVIPGRTFHYKLTYTDVASWEFVERNYGSLSQTAGDALIRDKMRGYYNEIGNSFSSKVKISTSNSSLIKFNDAGKWTCEGGSEDEFANRDINGGGTELKCTYDLKYLYVNGDGEADYLDDKVERNGTELTLGNNFYIPMTYQESKFSWKVEGDGLSTVNVRYIEENKLENKPLLTLRVETPYGEGGNNSCYVNIGKSNTIDDSSSGVTDSSNLHNTEEDKFYAYRSVTVNNPFPDGNIPENWSDNNDQLRLGKAYVNMANPDYSAVLTRNQLDSIRGNVVNYVSWNGINTSSSEPSATSQFVRSYRYFERINGKHCLYGAFDDSCDERVG